MEQNKERSLLSLELTPIPTRLLANTELAFFKSLWGLGTEEEEGYRTGPPAYICRLAEFIPWNRFRGPIHV
jgi:hypothetical protein